MILEYIFADNSREIIDLDKNIDVSDKWVNINLKSKLEFIKEFLPAFNSGQKIVLFDQNHKQLAKFHQENDINSLDLIDEVNKKNQLLFFTSGSSGFPLGAFKSREGLEEEIIELKQLLEKYQVKKVVVTVPFVHIYGVLAGLLLPYALDDITLVVKDDFLPYELLEESKEKNTLVITTPVFIKSLAKLSDSQDLSSSIFISSTGPIHRDDVNAFREKYQSDVMQIFGSTETAGIAYKLNDSTKWMPFSKVNVTAENEQLSVSSPFISSYILKEKIVKLEQPFTTEDIIELDSAGFTLVGRSNKIIKIAGKRISAMQIESIIETIEDVEAVIVELVYKKELLRSEQILITLQAKNKIDKKTIKQKISESYGVLTIPFTLKYIDKINYSSMGKKVLF